MTNPATGTPAAKPKQSFASQVMATVTARRVTDNTYRAQVARGRNETTERYAYPYLAWTWKDAPWRRVPVLRVAAMACDFPKIVNQPDRRYGAALHLLCHTPNDVDRVGLKLSAAYTMPVEEALYIWRSFLPRLEQDHIGFSWERLLSTALAWEHPDADYREQTRRAALEELYAATIPTPS